MSNTLSVQKRSASPQDVRDWLRANGYEPGTRGRFHPDHIKAFNAAHPGFGRYQTAGYKAVKTFTVRVSGKDRKVSIPAVRRVLSAAGEPVGKRGRVTKEQVLRALELASQQD